MRGFPAPLVVMVAGCAQIAGIDNTSAPKGGATLTITRVSIGSSAVASPQDLSMQMATFYVPDAKNPATLDAVPGVQTANGEWTAVVKGTPLVQFSLPDLPMPVQHLWELPATQLTGDFLAHEHANPQPPASTSQVMLAVNLPAGGYAGTETFEVFAVGAWMSHVLTAAELPTMVGATSLAATIPYSSFNPATESPPAAIVHDDVVLVLRSVASQLTGVYQTSFDQTSATDALGGNMVAIAADRMFAGPIDPAAVGTRLSAARPSVGNETTNWAISAAPGSVYGDAAGPLLDAGNVPAGTTSISAMYGNPFDALGWRALANVVISETRSATFMGVSISLGASLSVLGSADTLAFDFVAPIPEQVNLDDNQLVLDGTMVTIDTTQPHQVTIETENMPAQLYDLQLYDVTVAAGAMSATTTRVLDAVSTTTTFTIPPNVLQSGHTYIPQVTTYATSFPNAATGDLATRSLPIELARFDGGLFTVSP